jgi:dienelactone hydrolase
MSRVLVVLLCLAVGVIAQVAQVAQAGDDLTVLKDTQGVPPRKMLYEYLRGECQKHFDARRAVVAQLKTLADVQARQKMLRGKFLEAIGPFPERTPLKAQVVGHLKGDGFRVEKVIYESRPEHHVTALMYLPDPLTPLSPLGGEGSGVRGLGVAKSDPLTPTLSPRGEEGEDKKTPAAPRRIPGVLVPCGHSANGKAAEAYQRACILMAKNGLAVLCYDPIGQGERIQLLDATGKPAIAGSTSEHTMCGIGALLVGRSTAHYRIWDGIRSLDYLASRPEVDPERLGCAGNSGGGTLTAYLMALDDRILAAAPSCYITSLERLFATIGPQDAEQNITGQVAFGMEHADYITMRAPKPTLILTGTRDFFDIQGAWTSFRESKRIYGLMGHGERVDMFEYDDEHGWSKPRREAAAKFMVRWLLGKDVAITEPDFPIFKDAELQCTRTGQVLEDFKGKSVFDLNAEREAELEKKREGERIKDPDWIRSVLPFKIDEVLNAPRRLVPIGAPDVSGTVARGNTVIRKVAFKDWSPFSFKLKPGKSESELVFGTPISAPGLVFESKVSVPKEMILYLHGEGKAHGAGPGGAIEKLVSADRCVIAVDLCGLGETSPAQATGSGSNYFGSDSKEAFLALHLDSSLLARRVRQLAVIRNHTRSNHEKGPSFNRHHIVATGSTGPVALHWTVLAQEVKSLTLENSLLSWSAVVRSPISVNQLTNVVPGVLAYYDLPDLAALIAPRPLTIKNPVDAMGKPVSQAELEKVYARAIEAYKKAGAEKALVLIGRK